MFIYALNYRGKMYLIKYVGEWASNYCVHLFVFCPNSLLVSLMWILVGSVLIILTSGDL